MKHLVSVSDLSREAAIAILDTSLEMSEVNDRDIKKLPTLRGKTVVNLFFEDSTRTRISFEVAAKRLSADVINFAAKGSSVSKGESLKDTAQTLEAIGADAVVIRHHASGAAHMLANSGWVKGSVINAGDGTHEHPTQALLDAFTLRSAIHADARGKALDGVAVAIVGDIAHSRVARSNLVLLKKLGAKVYLVGPPTLLPNALISQADGYSYSLDDACATFKLDAVMMLRVQLERMTAGFFPSEREYARIWGLNADRLALLGSNTFVMHPGPMNRGLEIDAAAADSKNSLVLKQVANGVSVRMAVLYHLLSGGENE
ncbi:MAG: aspartate carbamoyltransferase catalytic subunit [Actinobacteria bacterium]|nr:aspartate carbamoyltransferase catalytic subunit [Actinomycetota bacterium]